MTEPLGDLDMTEFEKAMGAALPDDAGYARIGRARELLQTFLDDNGIDYGDPGMRWDAEAAAQLAVELEAAAEPAPQDDDDIPAITAEDLGDDEDAPPVIPESLKALAGIKS